MEALKIIPEVIRKFTITGVIVFLAIFFGFIAYDYLKYRIWKPYYEFISIDCKIKNNMTIVILTAKENLKEIKIYDSEDNLLKEIKELTKDSSDLAYVKHAVQPPYIKISFMVNNKSFNAVEECKIEESLLQKLLK